MIGVTALIVVLGVMSGFDKMLYDTVLGTTSHIVVTRDGGIKEYDGLIEEIKSVPEVVAAAPFFAGQVLIRSEDGVLGSAIRGVLPDRESEVSNFAEYLSGELTENGIVLGTELARQLHVRVGDKIRVISPYFVSTPAGEVPYKKTLDVTGFYRSGMYEYDSSFCFVTLSQAQRLFGVGSTIAGIEVKIEEPFRAEAVSSAISMKLRKYDYRVRTWMDMNRTFFAALRHEKIIMAVILILIIVVAAFNIASTLIMVVMEKTRDIGILKSIGAPASSIMTIFIIDGLMVGGVGTLFGVIFGYALANSLDSVVNFMGSMFGIELFPSTIYYFDKIPVDTSIFDTSWIVGSAILICLLASLYPAWQASRLSPVEALRYE